MKSIYHLQTMAWTYQEICQGEQPWIALGNFMNDWFDYAKDRRAELVVDPVVLPESPSSELFRWAVFCAASVEWFCKRYEVACPDWVYNSAYCLTEPWFYALQPDKPAVREWLLLQTPEPFTRRNVYCGNRMFANKYEFVEQYRSLTDKSHSPDSVLT
jgi:hypothetical protein